MMSDALCAVSDALDRAVIAQLMLHPRAEIRESASVAALYGSATTPLPVRRAIAVLAGWPQP